MGTRKRAITVRLSDDVHESISGLSQALGASQTAVIEVAVRNLNRQKSEWAGLRKEVMDLIEGQEEMRQIMLRNIDVISRVARGMVDIEMGNRVAGGIGRRHLLSINTTDDAPGD